MAEHANSIPVPELPICPLPANAPQAWHDFWQQMIFVAPPEKGSAAVMNAYVSGVFLEDLCTIQLSCPKDRIQAMPRLWFGDHHWAPCRIFSPSGEVEQ